MTSYEMMKWFMLNYPEEVESYRNSDHNYSSTELNPYHCEGSVWAHLCAVMAVAEVYKVSEEVKWALLIHDLGKPASEVRCDDTKRVHFRGHAGVSFWLGIKVLKKAGLPESMRKHILELVSFHFDFFNLVQPSGSGEARKLFYDTFRGNKKLATDLVQHYLCDNMGRLGASSQLAKYKPEDIVEWTRPFLDDLSDTVYTSFVCEQEVIVLSGLPCTGKSTWAKKWCVLHPHTYISIDEYIEAKAKKNMTTYDHAWQFYIKDAESEYNERLQAAYRRKDKLIILDRTHLSKKSRRKSVGQAPKSYKKTCLLFVADCGTLAKRHKARAIEGKTIPEKHLLDMMKSFRVPTYELFDEVKWVGL